MAKKKSKRDQQHAEPKAAPPAADDHGDETDLQQHATGDERFQPCATLVGVGASAGGLQALSELLIHLAPNAGLTLVVVQHLAPKHPSALSELLSAKTPLPVIEAAEGMTLEPNHVYVIPPDRQMAVQQGKLHLTPRPSDGRQHLPINYFFRSLADDCGNKAIGVILSGTASDGAEGLREIKSVGGIAIAQDPETAAYDGMPQAAIATGVVDLVLSPQAIAAELLRLARHPYVSRRLPRRPGEEFAVNDDQMGRMFLMLRTSSGVDFSQYKQPTIKRRLQRRMALHKFSTAEQYLRYLQQNAGEVKLLYQDMLINVTRFFREPDSFEALRKVAFAKILENRGTEGPIRVWVPGCSTGEEPYSLAITLLEYLGDQASSVPIQVFATDVSEAAIQTARTGTYPASIADDVSPARLLRFFSKVDGNYRISKAVRDMCVFARQDVTRDPPFSRLDLIACRNVLIYLGPSLQKRLMSVFHYALRAQGFLMLGSAESVGPLADLYKVVDKRHRIYSKKITMPQFEMDFRPAAGGPSLARLPRKGTHEPPSVAHVQAEANQVLLSRFAPAGVIVNAELQIVQFRGQTGAWLEPAPGEASLNVLKMAREGLLYGLRTALHEARESQTTVRKVGLKVKADGGQRDVNLEVIPLAIDEEPRHYLVLFEDPGAGSPAAAAPAQPPEIQQPDEQKVSRLQQELAASREYLQSIIQELEAANEELQSANEEILSSNEELQSTNEELDTAKEELQSTNEELNTVNDELHGRNEELSLVNSDLVNLLHNVQIAIVIVAMDLRIRRFTPMAEKVLNLIPSDVGRPISHIKPNIDYSDLERMISDVIERTEPQARDVRDLQGHWYSLRIRPYKNMENRIDGAVLALFDIDAAKRYTTDINDLRLFAEGVVDVVREPLVVLDGERRVRMANRAFCTLCGVAQADVMGKALIEIADGQWNDPAIRDLLAKLSERDEPIEGFATELRAGGGRRPLLLNGRRIAGEHPGSVRYLLAVHPTEG
ncbi:MAG TPA: chemotaxis protein CheB [Pirellulales bacterium]|nr:chemotaxis protein CheB [Pirellulales bacterium]